MSSFFKGIRNVPDSRSLIKQIMRRIQELEAKQNALSQTSDLKGYMRSNNDRLILLTDSFTTALSDSTSGGGNLHIYKMPLEPDGVKLTLWLKFLYTTDTGASAQHPRDESGFDHIATREGGPVGANGPVNGLPAYFFDGVDDGIVVAHDGTISIVGSTIGFSVSFYLNPNSVALTTAGGTNTARIVACKTDDDPTTGRDYGWVIWFEPNGTLYFAVRFAGVWRTHSVTSAINPANLGNDTTGWYLFHCTYDKSTQIPKIYKNGVGSTDAVTSYLGPNIALPTQSNLLHIAGSDYVVNVSMGRYQGRLADFEYWHEKILTTSEVANKAANKYSISNITDVARMGVASFASSDTGGGTPPPPPPPPPPGTLRSYTTTSFTTTSFT